MKWVPHLDREDDNGEDAWSITNNPEYSGWNTDSGYTGYGLPFELAQWICDQLNKTEEKCPYKNNEGYWEKL